MPNRKKKSDFLNCIYTMGNGLNIFLKYYFQRKKTNAMLIIPHYNPEVLGLNLFLNYFFHPQMKWMKKNSQNKKKLKLPQEATMFSREK